mmetsp:Transcript_13466/g.16323  ORF Transcript_13466/g.16323 Transcript_13466/m.16323 type:complete len:119 (+) Transcript_13466:626-982(+)
MSQHHFVHSAIDNGQLTPEQYSIPGKKAIDHALNRRLLFGIIRYKKKTSLVAMASCDLSSCYDRIAHTPAILSMHRLNIPTAAATGMFNTIQECQHNIRTVFGDSTITYGGLDEKYFT